MTAANRPMLTDRCSYIFSLSCTGHFRTLRWSILGLSLSAAGRRWRAVPIRTSTSSPVERPEHARRFEVFSSKHLLRSLCMRTRWAINAELVVTHEVEYRLLDQDFDAASE